MKVPEPRKLPSGSWHVRMRLDGENVSITRPTKTECRHAAEDIKSAYRNGRWQKEKKSAEETLGKIVDNYIESRKTVLSPATIAGYQVVRRNRFKDFMKKKPSGIKNWQALIDSEVKDKISGKTIRNSWSLVSAALTYAKLPVPIVALPPVVKSVHPWLDDEQIRTFCKAIEGNEYEIPMLLCLHSLRRSEVFAMDWSQIDLQNNVIHVKGAVVRDENNKLIHKKENKTEDSQRDISIMIPRLSELLNAVPKSKRKGKIYTQPENYLWKEINNVCRENSLPEIGCHGLRHSICSLAFHVGLSERETMEIGGWRSPDVMRRVYHHISAADKLKAENKISQFFASDKNAIQNADENSQSQQNKAL